MGAYLHLRGLAELDDVSESGTNRDRLHYLSEPGSEAVEVASTSTPRAAASIGSWKEANHAATNEMDDCSNFWAGQLDGVFVELQVKTGYRGVPRARMELNNSGEEDDLKIPREQGLDIKEKGDSCSGWSGSIQNAHLEKRASDDASLMGHGGKFSAAAASGSSTSSAELLGDGNSGSALADGHIHGLLRELGSNPNQRGTCQVLEDESERLPDHLLIELLVRVPTRDWPAAACVKKRWAQLFEGDGLWQNALMKKWPGATSTKRWPGPIARGSSKRRYTALYVSDSLFAKDKIEGVSEVAGHVYLFLKEQLESSTPPVSYGLLHGTIIDQFLACCKTGDEAHDLASHIWIAVLDNLDESENTFHLLMRIAEEWEIFLPYPYLKSQAVQWRVFERLFTDFRGCLLQYNYFDVLTRARSKFELIPQTWLGY